MLNPAAAAPESFARGVGSADDFWRASGRTSASPRYREDCHLL